MFKIVELKNGFKGLEAITLIQEGTRLFSYEEWIEDEKRGWDLLTIEEVDLLDQERRKQFLHFGYDIDFGKIRGTFDFARAVHGSNFINHSCNPSLHYDTQDCILAARDIKPGEELTLDYGNFIVNVDQTFQCDCNQPGCRNRILKDDWKWMLHSMGYNFPTFMHKAIANELNGYAPLRTHTPAVSLI